MITLPTRLLTLCMLVGYLSTSEVAPPAIDGWMGTHAQLKLFQTAPIAVLRINGVIPDEVGSAASQIDVQLDHQITWTIKRGLGSFETRRIITTPIGQHTIDLKAQPLGALPAPDGRAAAARITLVAIDPIVEVPTTFRADSETDVTSNGVGLGAGWHPVETWQGEHFRWCAAEGEIGIAPALLTQDAVLTLTCEPGPGSVGSKRQAQLLDADGSVLDHVELPQRMTADLVVPASARDRQPLRLRMEGAAKTPGDARQLNLRVFHIVLQTATSR